MKDPPSRSGFTLVEVLIASTILIIVVAQFAVAGVACMRMFHGAIAQSELSIKMRELRERLLFHLRPPDEGRFYAGLLSATSIAPGSRALRVSGGDVVPMPLTVARNDVQSHAIAFEDDEAGGSYLVDADAPADEGHLRWLHAGGLFLHPDLDWSTFVEYGKINEQNRLYLTLTLAAESTAGIDWGSRTERIVVPIFGKAQTRTEELK